MNKPNAVLTAGWICFAFALWFWGGRSIVGIVWIFRAAVPKLSWMTTRCPQSIRLLDFFLNSKSLLSISCIILASPSPSRFVSSAFSSLLGHLWARQIYMHHSNKLNNLKLQNLLCTFSCRTASLSTGAMCDNEFKQSPSNIVSYFILVSAATVY